MPPLSASNAAKEWRANTRLSWVACAFCFLCASSIFAVEDPLTAPEVEAYYHAKFKMSRQDNVKDSAIKDSSTTLTIYNFLSTVTPSSPRNVSLLVRRSLSPVIAHELCNTARDLEKSGAVKIEEVTGVGDYAYWFGRQLNFCKGNNSYVLSAQGVKEPRDINECRAASLELAKKVLAREN